jgi:hypothetical protein
MKNKGEVEMLPQEHQLVMDSVLEPFKNDKIKDHSAVTEGIENIFQTYGIKLKKNDLQYLKITGDNEITYQDDEDEFYRVQLDGMNTPKIEKVQEHGKQIEHTHLTKGIVAEEVMKNWGPAAVCFKLSKNRLLLATRHHLFVKKNSKETDEEILELVNNVTKERVGKLDDPISKVVDNPANWEIVASAKNTDIVETGHELDKNGI